MYSPRQRARYLAACAVAESSSSTSTSSSPGSDAAVRTAIEELLSASRGRAVVRQETLGYIGGLRHEAMRSGGLNVNDSMEGRKADPLKMTAGLNSMMGAHSARKTTGGNRGQKEEEQKTDAAWNVVDADR